MGQSHTHYDSLPTGDHSVLPVDGHSYQPKSIEYNLLVTESAADAELISRQRSNLQAVYPLVAKFYEDGFTLNQLKRIPCVKFDSKTLFQVVLSRASKSTRRNITEKWQLHVKRSFVMTEHSNSTITTHVTELWRDIQEEACRGGRLVSIEPTIPAAHHEVQEIDVFFDVPRHFNPSFFIYQAISVPVLWHREKTQHSQDSLECDWFTHFITFLSEGWKLVEIMFDSSVRHRVTVPSRTLTMNSIWVFEKQAKHENDQTPRWEGVIVRYLHKSYTRFEDFRECFAKTSWNKVIHNMGKQGWVLACIVTTPPTIQKGSLMISIHCKILMFFQRPFTGNKPFYRRTSSTQGMAVCPIQMDGAAIPEWSILGESHLEEGRPVILPPYSERGVDIGPLESTPERTQPQPQAIPAEPPPTYFEAVASDVTVLFSTSLNNISPSGTLSLATEQSWDSPANREHVSPPVVSHTANTIPMVPSSTTETQYGTINDPVPHRARPRLDLEDGSSDSTFPETSSDSATHGSSSGSSSGDSGNAQGVQLHRVPHGDERGNARPPKPLRAANKVGGSTVVSAPSGTSSSTIPTGPGPRRAEVRSNTVSADVWKLARPVGSKQMVGGQTSIIVTGSVQSKVEERASKIPVGSSQRWVEGSSTTVLTGSGQRFAEGKTSATQVDSSQGSTKRKTPGRQVDSGQSSTDWRISKVPFNSSKRSIEGAATTIPTGHDGRVTESSMTVIHPGSSAQRRVEGQASDIPTIPDQKSAEGTTYITANSSVQRYINNKTAGPNRIEGKTSAGQSRSDQKSIEGRRMCDSKQLKQADHLTFGNAIVTSSAPTSHRIPSKPHSSNVAQQQQIWQNSGTIPLKSSGQDGRNALRGRGMQVTQSSAETSNVKDNPQQCHQQRVPHSVTANRPIPLRRGNLKSDEATKHKDGHMYKKREVRPSKNIGTLKNDSNDKRVQLSAVKRLAVSAKMQPKPSQMHDFKQIESIFLDQKKGVSVNMESKAKDLTFKSTIVQKRQERDYERVTAKSMEVSHQTRSKDDIYFVTNRTKREMDGTKLEDITNRSGNFSSKGAPPIPPKTKRYTEERKGNEESAPPIDKKDGNVRPVESIRETSLQQIRTMDPTVRQINKKPPGKRPLPTYNEALVRKTQIRSEGRQAAEDSERKAKSTPHDLPDLIRGGDDKYWILNAIGDDDVFLSSQVMPESQSHIRIQNDGHRGKQCKRKERDKMRPSYEVSKGVLAQRLEMSDRRSLDSLQSFMEEKKPPEYDMVLAKRLVKPRPVKQEDVAPDLIGHAPKEEFLHQQSLPSPQDSNVTSRGKAPLPSYQQVVHARTGARPKLKASQSNPLTTETIHQRHKVQRYSEDESYPTYSGSILKEQWPDSMMHDWECQRKKPPIASYRKFSPSFPIEEEPRVSSLSGSADSFDLISQWSQDDIKPPPPILNKDLSGWGQTELPSSDKSDMLWNERVHLADKQAYHEPAYNPGPTSENKRPTAWATGERMHQENYHNLSNSQLSQKHVYKGKEIL